MKHFDPYAPAQPNPYEMLEMMRSELYDLDVRINCYDEDLFEPSPSGLVIKGYVADYFAKLAIMIEDLEQALDNPSPAYRTITRIRKTYIDRMPGV